MTGIILTDSSGNSLVDSFGNPLTTLDPMLTVTLGAKIALSVRYLDQTGNPMRLQPVPDATPPVAWTNTAPATETLTVAGSTATAATIAAGADAISVALSVNGVPYTASLAVTVEPPPQGGVIDLSTGDVAPELAGL
jgi:hypothetical protein